MWRIQQGYSATVQNFSELLITATGAEFRPYPPTVLTAGAMAQGATRHLVDVTQILFEASLTLTDFMMGEIAREDPDLLIFDAIALWGAQAARLSGLPAVASITTFILEGAQIQATGAIKYT